MFGKTAAMLVSFTASLTLEIASRHLFLHRRRRLAQPSAPGLDAGLVAHARAVRQRAAAGALGGVRVARLMLRKAAGRRRVAASTERSQSSPRRKAPPVPRDVRLAIGVYVDGRRHGCGAGGCVECRALAAGDSMRGIVRAGADGYGAGMCAGI